MPERARAQDSRLAKTCHGDLQKGSEDWKEVLPGVRAGVYFIDSGEFAEDSGDGEMSEPQTNWVNEEDPVKQRLKYILDSPPHAKGGFHPETVRTALEALARIEELEAQLAEEEAPSPTDFSIGIEAINFCLSCLRAGCTADEILAAWPPKYRKSGVVAEGKAK